MADFIFAQSFEYQDYGRLHWIFPSVICQAQLLILKQIMF